MSASATEVSFKFQFRFIITTTVWLFSVEPTRDSFCFAGDMQLQMYGCDGPHNLLHATV